ncbi:MAG: hypothetical protein H6751_04325 [Candidatus Omnitrophica bacterium]|nr:hypothetical protein [Candidatus Omnitrophota bacterium]
MKDACKSIGHHFLEHLYGELDEFTERRVVQHLAECKKCGEEIREWKATLDLIDASTLEPDEELSEQFSPIVLSIIQRRMSDRRGPTWATTAAAACLAMAFLAQIHFGEGPRPVETLHRESLPPVVSQVREMEDPLLEQVAMKTRFVPFG